MIYSTKLRGWKMIKKIVGDNCKLILKVLKAVYTTKVHQKHQAN